MQHFCPVIGLKKEATLDKTTTNCVSFLAKFGDLFNSIHPEIAIFTKKSVSYMQKHCYS